MTMQNRYFCMTIPLATAVSSASDYTIQAISVVEEHVMKQNQIGKFKPFVSNGGS